jgi:hypothetical protein
MTTWNTTTIIIHPRTAKTGRTLQLARTSRGMGDAHPFPNKLVHVDRTFRRDEKNGATRRYPSRCAVHFLFDAARRWVPPRCVVVPVFDATSIPPHCTVLPFLTATRRGVPLSVVFLFRRGKGYTSCRCHFCNFTRFK